MKKLHLIDFKATYLPGLASDLISLAFDETDNDGFITYEEISEQIISRFNFFAMPEDSFNCMADVESHISWVEHTAAAIDQIKRLPWVEDIPDA